MLLVEAPTAVSSQQMCPPNRMKITRARKRRRRPRPPLSRVQAAMNVKQLLDLGGRVALVTGGSRGLGLPIAQALGEMGARLALTARKKDELDEAVSHLKGLGVEATAHVCDLGK